MSDKYFDFLLKEIINHEVNKVLDKIEEEISNLKGTFPSEYYLKIIDKYRDNNEIKESGEK